MDVIVCLQKKYEGVCLSNRNCANVRIIINVNDKLLLNWYYLYETYQINQLLSNNLNCVTFILVHRF